MDSSPSSRMEQLPLEPDNMALEPTRKPSLLPAFEPFSSSPVLPRPTSSKRKYGEDSPSYPKQQLKYYPTPVPTSSTGMLPSSPQNPRPSMQRSISMLSERQPLGAVPTIDLPADGEVVKMGRSTNSSDYQLSTNRLISRVHVQAAYHAPSAPYPNGYIELECIGWNGAKVHCKGRVFELQKGDTYMTENREAEIMLDVQDTRVMIAWPIIPAKLSWDSDDDTTPTHQRIQDAFASSPPIAPRSPVSQSPMRQPVFTTEPIAPAPAPASSAVQIFEDADAGESANIDSPKAAETTTFICPQSQPNSSQDAEHVDTKASVMSSFNAADDFSDGDEENDPVVHSFGPFGDNLLPRLASFTHDTPTQLGGSGSRRRRNVFSSPAKLTPSIESVLFKHSPIKNHVINQLAYSRLHSQPLSAIHSNLPAELKACITNDKGSGDGQKTPVPQLSKQDLKKLLDETPCVGEIPRSGKDAAGQPLENEFYYVPEMDMDTTRRETVTMGMRGAGGLRAVRKQHK